MRNILKRTAILLCLVSLSSLSAINKTDNVITFFVKPYPEVRPTTAVTPSLFSPGTVYKNLTNSIIPTLGHTGLFATYAGYLAHTSDIGQITFPRKTQQSEFDMFITNNIKPYLMAGTTNVRYWIVEEEAPVTRYNIKRLQDGKTDLYYWQVTKGTLGPKRIIPLHSIVVFAKPKNIFIPQGITLTNDLPHFILPAIYTKPQLDDVKNALEVLNLKIFFQPLHPTFKKGKLEISQLIKH